MKSSNMKKSITLLSQSFLMLALMLIFDHSAYAQRIPGTWEEKAAMGSGRFWAFSFALDGKVYGGTGRPQFSATNPLNDFWEYDPATDVWTQKAREKLGLPLKGKVTEVDAQRVRLEAGKLKTASAIKAIAPSAMVQGMAVGVKKLVINLEI